MPQQLRQRKRPLPKSTLQALRLGSALLVDFSSTPPYTYMRMEWPGYPWSWGWLGPFMYPVLFAWHNPMLSGGILCLIVVLFIRFSMPMGNQLFLLLFVSVCFIAFMPIMVSIFAAHYGVALFDECQSPQMKDVTWLVLDNVSRGLMMHFMETFNIAFFRCAPNKASWVVSALQFTIRMFATYIPIWCVLKIWKMWRR